jgi:hypothetical protein
VHQHPDLFNLTTTLAISASRVVRNVTVIHSLDSTGIYILFWGLFSKTPCQFPWISGLRSRVLPELRHTDFSLLKRALMSLNVDMNFGIELSSALLMCVAILSGGRSRPRRRVGK